MDEQSEREEWRQVKGSGFEMYEVSSLGRVRSWAIGGTRAGQRLAEPRIKSLRVNPVRGYLQVTIGGRNAFVHRLVATTFHGPRPDGLLCRHLDGNKLNNAASNLAWGTRLDNAADDLIHGTRVRGERMGNARLTEDVVREIRFSTESLRCIARRLGVSVTAIAQVRNGKTWSHVKD